MYAVVHVYLYIGMPEVVTECLPQLLSICDVVCCGVCVCLLYVRIHVCMHMGICVCMPACGSLRWIWGVFFDCTPFCLLRHCLSAEPRTWGLAGLTSYLALRITHLGLPSP